MPAAPVTLGTAVISLGPEDHASFSTHAVHSAATAPHRTVPACELLGAARALRLSGARLPDTPLREAYRTVTAGLPHLAEDHPLGGEIHQAEQLLDELATLCGHGSAALSIGASVAALYRRRRHIAPA